jgi:NitT/TauT family transport system permease protein
VSEHPPSAIPADFEDPLEASAEELEVRNAELRPPVGPTGGRRRRRRRSGGALRQVIVTVAILVAVIVLWALGSHFHWWREAVLPPPIDVWHALLDILPTSTFWSALGITAREIVATLIGGLVIGFGLGVVFWKVPYLGRIAEPYLVSFYAVPFIVFYPVMVVLIGLNSWPIIILATTMAVIPMALNTWIGLAGVSSVYWKLAASLQCNRRQTMFRIAIPAAAPIVLSGVRLALIYSLIGSVSMEFLLAPNGLGFQIRYQYELFKDDTMLAYVVVVFAIAGLLAVIISLMEARVLGRRRPL